ncbi:exo-alpha-sialidase [Kribbella sp. NPDC005582]|uniref:exo-alpha-sialidase n=1 Tax=Kribbella sp. NPDC005582 TaxID=3156893 RepID=UPI0033AB1743
MRALVAVTAVALLFTGLTPAAQATSPTPLLNYASPVTLNGTTGYVDHTADLSAVAGLGSGTIVARFKSTSTASAMTLLSASDISDPSSNLTLSLNANTLHFEIRENTGTAAAYRTNLNYPTVNDPVGSYNDGRWHTVAVTVGADGTRVFADGHQVYAGTSTAFFDDVTELDGLWVGRNVDNGGGQWYYNGTIDSVRVYDSALSAADVLALSPPPDARLAYSVNQSFDGATTYVDKTGDLAAVAGLSSGTIVARFNTSSNAPAKALLSAADTRNPSSNLTLSINDGALYFESRNNGTYSTRLSSPGRYNDGEWHTIAVTVSAAGTFLYGDGYRTAYSANTGFFAAVSALNGLWIGRNVDSGGGQWYFDGSIDRIQVYPAALTDSEIKNATATAPQTHLALFDNGYANSANYRIPSLLVTSAGTLLAGADQRTTSAADSPNDINLVVRRSTDSGTTWSPSQTLLDYPGSGADGASAIDSEMLQDSTTGRIYLLVDHFPGGVGLPNSVAGTGFDSTGRLLLTDNAGASYSLHTGGEVYNSAGVLTTYRVDSQGNVTKSGAPAGNIYLKTGSLLEARTSFLKLLFSDDDGVTWSTAADLNQQVKAPWMKFLGTGPGNGVQLRNGRLVFPVYYSNASGTMSSAVVYSDDHGVTWRRGESPNDGRSWQGTTINSQTVTDRAADLTEAAVQERRDGTLVLRMRNTSGTGKIAVSSSTDGGATWGDVTYDAALPDVVCQPAALNYPGQEDRVLFANTTRGGRQDGVLRLSLDGGNTWKHSRTLKAGGYAYNSIAVLPNGDVAVLWELQNQGLYFSKVPLSWLTSSAS